MGPLRSWPPGALGPMSLHDPMGDLDMYYSLSFFIKQIRKWQALILTYLENMVGLKSQWMNIFLFLWLPQEEDHLGNQNEGNKKHHSEESLKELNS